MLTKLLLVESSAYQRILFSKMLSSYKNIHLVDVVRDGKEAVESILKNSPNVIVMDLELPKTNDVEYIQFIMKNFFVPLIFLISSDLKKKDTSLNDLISAAFDLIVKPNGIWREEIPKIEKELISKILLASKSNKSKINDEEKLIGKNSIINSNLTSKVENKFNFEKIPHVRHEEHFFDRSPINIKTLETNAIVMGASVGGPRTIKAIIEKIPQDFPSPIFIVQHMNNFFMRQFAVNLREKSLLQIRMGKNGEFIQPGNIYIAQGDKHMQIVERNGRPCIRIFDGEPVNFCRPSVDVLFYSAARVYKQETIGILLTGMGADGVAGLKAIKEAGGKTISESSETAILYGMPKVAAELGVADHIIPNYQIPNYMIKYAKKLA
ncbi:MAG: chemotaxis-specific protein-glutamate methyltransferase CheB [Promethearchaeota archaeon]|nr:MAG: chemotaxis-specific protein-glutamate methyltransferase CheB [Candidatus Lokiarchaeota archaeon]